MSVSKGASSWPGARTAAPFLWAFVVSVAVAIAALLFVRLAPLSTAVLDDGHRRWILDILPSDEIAALKIRHAEMVPAYDVGLFGNSRILMIGARELGLGNRRVFNFAVPGQSIQQSIRLLEELRARGKLPKIALISMDHVELGLQGGAAVYPGPPWRWLQALSDLRIVWSRDGWRAAAVQIVNTLAAEGRELAITFNRSFVQTKVEALVDSTKATSRYRPDGSRIETPPAGPVVIGRLSRRAEHYPELEHDLNRLRTIQQDGVRIVIYESPIAPQLVQDGEQQLSSNARDVRRRFHAACKSMQLECYGPPLLNSMEWFDRDHAPAPALARWLRAIVNDKH